MDLTQLSQMVAWLDEEHRRDREEIAKLDQRLQGMVIENQEQSRQIQELEGRLANTQAQLTQFAQIQQALQQLKNEVVVLLDKQSEARLQSEREIERARMSDREASARSIAEIRKELPRIGRIEEELVSRRAEDQRLGEMLLALRQSVNNVSKDLDERTRTLPYMVEQRAQDNKRIAQLQAEHVELLKRTDAIAAKPPLLEERISRLERDLGKIQPIPEQLRTEQQAFLEMQRVTDVERTRQMAVWEAEFLQQRELIEKQVVRLREFTAQYEAAGRAIKTLEEFQASMIRDQRQVSELQRLAEERQRKELAEWQGENEQRWKKETLRWDYTIQEQQKVNQKLADRFPPLEKIVVLLQREIAALWKLHEQVGARQLQEAQHLLDLIGKALEERPKAEA
jgi:DNA repair exonuclease SbcCD ATPase subunit